MIARTRLPAGSTWKALVADDDDDTRSLMAAALRRVGFEVSEFVNGHDLVMSFRASFKAHATAQTVVVSDIGMPECDGIAATIALRESDPHTPILLVTAFGDAGTVREARRAGANHVLLKPLDLSALVRAAIDLVGKVPA